MKTLIIHDRFMFRGGAERLVLIMARGLGADICTGFWSDSECYPKSEVPHKLFVLGNPSQTSGWRYLKFQWLFYFKTKFIRDYDLVIFSGNNCLSAAHNVRPGVKKIFYCHTPVRHAYDLKNYYLKNKVWWKRIIMRCFIPMSKVVYRWGLSKMDTIIANSKNVQERLTKYLHRDAVVVWPPIQTDKFKWLSQGDYYLSFARVDQLKRVGDIVRAFQKMPGKKLVVASAGDDLNNVKKLATGSPNIQVLGWQSDEELRSLVGNCIASIYIPINEDAGMTPLESMSAGKPCIGVYDGGLKETIIDEKNGKFIPANYTIDDIIKAVEWLSPERALSMRTDCEAQAQKFGEEKFVEGIKSTIYSERSEESRLRQPIIIGIDASRSVDSIQKTGVELVSDELLKTVNNQQSASSNQKIIYYTPSETDWLPRKNQKILRWPFKFLWTQVRLAWELIFHPPEKMFFPVHAMPLLIIASYKLKVTSYYKIIHDIAFKKQPQLYSLKQKFILNLDLWLARKLCTKIFVPTEAVKNYLTKYTKINPGKIVVTPWGYNPKTQNAISKTQKKKQILYIGRVEEKKNIENLIKGFQIFSKEYPDYKLVLAGKIDKRFMIYDLGFKNLEALGYINEEKKYELLRESTALVLVSKEEGFGFPILEAFDFDLPVLASDIPVLREIGGDACLYANPDSPERIADKLEQIITDEDLSQKLTTSGHERLKQFDWQKTTEKMLREITR